MQKYVWKLMVLVSGALASMAIRRLVAALWPGEPPRNPDDESTSLSGAVGWAALSGLSAGAARVLSRKGATAAFEKVYGESPPGVQTA